MKHQTYYTNNNQITDINYLSFDKKKLHVIYIINGKEYITTARYRRFEVNVRKYYLANNY